MIPVILPTFPFPNFPTLKSGGKLGKLWGFPFGELWEGLGNLGKFVYSYMFVVLAFDKQAATGILSIDTCIATQKNTTFRGAPMYLIDDVTSLTMLEIDYRLEALTETQKIIMPYMIRGWTDTQIAVDILVTTRANVQSKIANACERVGVRNRVHLAALYSVWLYAKVNPDFQKAVVPVAEGEP